MVNMTLLFLVESLSSPPHFRDIGWKDRQPDGGKLEACTLIVITSLHTLSEWYDVPCASNEADQYICVQNAMSIGKIVKNCPATYG